MRIARIEGLIERTSLPAMRGAAMSAHNPMWVRYSVSVMPPFPISSMSGSLDVPGPVAAACAAFRSKLRIIVAQSSEMSSDMRHWWAVMGPQAHGSSEGLLSLALSRIGRPEATIASRQRAKRSFMTRPLALQRSALM